MQKLKDGDRVKIILVGDIEDVHEDRFSIGNRYSEGNIIFPGANHIVSIEKVKRPRPPVNSVISGAQLKDIWWKRGTVIRELAREGDDHWPDNQFVVLNEAGMWYDVNSGICITFDACPDDAVLEVVYLP